MRDRPRTRDHTAWSWGPQAKCHSCRFFIDIASPFMLQMRISLDRRDVAGDSRTMERVRFLRAGLVTPFSGGSGIVSSGTTTGARGAPLKRDRRRR
jgi:hypothetical protein